MDNERLTIEPGICAFVSTEECLDQKDCCSCKRGKAAFQQLHQYAALGTVAELTALKDQAAGQDPRPLTPGDIQERIGLPVYSGRHGWGIVGKKNCQSRSDDPIVERLVVGYSYGWEWIEDVLRSGPLYDDKPAKESKK